MYLKSIIIAHLYHPGSAATNRILAYAKGFRELGLDVQLVLGCNNQEKEPILDGVKVFMVADVSRNNVTRDMASTIKQVYQKGSSVILVYGTPSLCWYLPHPRYNIFYECTEIPYWGKKKTIVSTIKEIFKSYLAKRATGMMVISNALKQYFLDVGIHNIEVINMFVDAARFNIKVENSQKYIAYCGYVSVSKDGVDTLIKSFKIFYQKNQDYKLYIIGRFVSEKDKQLLERIVDQENLGDAIVFTGEVAPSEIPLLLCGARILALARPNNVQAQYGFPTKLGEYLATGKPVVVSSVGEITIFMKNRVNCILANPDDPLNFAEKMLWVEEHYQDALIIGEKGRELVLSEFSNIKQCERAIDFIKNAINDYK